MNQNVFEMLGVEKRELSYSNFLAWLMNPSLNGAVDDDFLRDFLGLEDLKSENIKYNLSADSVEVSREVPKAKSEADIVVINEEFQLIIENKVKSKEGKKQTCRLHDDWSGLDKDEIFVYLTPEYRENCELDDEFEHITYTQIRDILEDMDKSSFEERTKIMIEDFIEALEVNRLVEFDGFSDESIEYVEIIKETNRKKKEWRKQTKQFFQEIKRGLKEKLNDDWNTTTNPTNIRIAKNSWENVHYSCKLNDGQVRDGVVEVLLWADNDLVDRKEKYKIFKEKYDGKRKLATKAAWIKERDSQYFEQIMDGGDDLAKELIDELYDLIRETEEPIERALEE